MKQHISPEATSQIDPMVNALVDGVKFDGAGGPQELRYVPALGFMVMNQGPWNEGGFMVAGFMGHRGNRYSEFGGYPFDRDNLCGMPERTGTLNQQELREHLLHTGSVLRLGNHMLAPSYGQRPEGLRVELWAAYVGRRVLGAPGAQDDWSWGTEKRSHRMTSGDLGISWLTRGNLQSYRDQPQAGVGHLSVYAVNRDTRRSPEVPAVRGMLGDITFPTKPGVTPKPVPLVRLGTVSSEVFLARAIESGGRYL